MSTTPLLRAASRPSRNGLRNSALSTTAKLNHSDYLNTLSFDWHVARVAVAN